MADCVVAEDSDFCQCVVENDGNTEIVSERERESCSCSNTCNLLKVCFNGSSKRGEGLVEYHKHAEYECIIMWSIQPVFKTVGLFLRDRVMCLSPLPVHSWLWNWANYRRRGES